MDNALTGAVIGIAAALLTIFLTPLVQQYFWVGKQREELRLKTVDEINALLSDYITKHIDAEHRGERYDPPVAFFQSLRVADAKLKVLFSEGTLRVYKRAEVMISHGGLGPGGSIDGFISAQEDALRAMYKELGFYKGFITILLWWLVTPLNDIYLWAARRKPPRDTATAREAARRMTKKE